MFGRFTTHLRDDVIERILKNPITESYDELCDKYIVPRGHDQVRRYVVEVMKMAYLAGGQDGYVLGAHEAEERLRVNVVVASEDDANALNAP